MATRFYLPSSNNVDSNYNNIPFSGAWAITGSADKVTCSISPLSTLMTDKTTANSSDPQNILNRQYISPRLKAQTIDGFVSGQLRGRQSNSAMNATSAVCINVYSTGALLRGTLLPIVAAPLTAANEYTTSLVNRFTPSGGIALNSLTIEANDVIVIEIGAAQEASSPNRNVTQRFGDSAASDLPVNQSTTTDLNSWIEFSFNLDFMPTASYSNMAIAWMQDDF